MIHRSLYKRQVDVNNLLKDDSGSTILTNNGMNPGIVSSCVKQGLEDYCNTFGTKADKNLLRAKKFNLLAKNLNLEEIHISELDTQTFNIKRKDYEFFSTWSAVGFWAEALDPVQMGWGSNRPQDEGIKPPGEGNVRIFPTRGMDCKCNSFVFGIDYNNNDPKKNIVPMEINGMLIPHAEADTISSFLSTEDYRPSVFYVYEPSQIALQSIEDLRDHKYHPPPNSKCHVMTMEECVKGFDAVGALLIFKDKRMHWCGSILDVNMAKDLGFLHSGPTVVQVASSVFAGMKYILNKKHSNDGYQEPEDLDYKFILKTAKPYLGKFISKSLF